MPDDRPLRDYATVRAYLLAMPAAVEDYPFGPEALVPKVGGKMFALLADDAGVVKVSLKVEPEHGEFLRSSYPAIGPGYHLNKRHWVTIVVDGSLPDGMLADLIDDSWALVVAGLARKVRQNLGIELPASG